MIPQSLICLRTALEAVQANEMLKNSHGNDLRNLHTSCVVYDLVSYCASKFISNLTSYLDRYEEELSKLLLSKNKAHTKSSWISIFCSLCIHSYVRRVLLHIAESHGVAEGLMRRGCNQYLRLAVRLFIAASGRVDELSQLDKDPSLLADLPKSYQLIHDIVRRKTSQLEKAFSSADFLKAIYEDNGEPLHGSIMDLDRLGNMSESGIVSPQVGGFSCSSPGCIAGPFQTQARAHYPSSKPFLTYSSTC